MLQASYPVRPDIAASARITGEQYPRRVRPRPT